VITCTIALVDSDNNIQYKQYNNNNNRTISDNVNNAQYRDEKNVL